MQCKAFSYNGDTTTTTDATMPKCSSCCFFNEAAVKHGFPCAVNPFGTAENCREYKPIAVAAKPVKTKPAKYTFSGNMASCRAQGFGTRDEIESLELMASVQAHRYGGALMGLYVSLESLKDFRGFSFLSRLRYLKKKGIKTLYLDLRAG